MTDDTPCFIYAICRLQGRVMVGPVKIGISQAPHLRLRELQVGSPYKLAICVAIMLENRSMARHVEVTTHERIKDHRLNGEWFEVHPLEATGEISMTLAKSFRFQDRDGIITKVKVSP